MNIFEYYDIWMGLTFVILFFLALTWGDLIQFYRSDRRLSFKILVSFLILGSVAFVVTFLGGLFYILNHTSFINHIRDGDLVEHLKKAL